MSIVLCLGHDLEIADAVVLRVAITMMNDLVRAQESPKVLFHDQSVLHDVTLGVRVRVVRRQDREVSAVPSVADPSLISRVSHPSNIDGSPTVPAGEPAELSRPLADGGNVLAALTASVRRRVAPPSLQIAGPRTEARGTLPPILWVKRGSAVFALQAGGFSSHVSHYITITKPTARCELPAQGGLWE